MSTGELAFNFSVAFTIFLANLIVAIVLYYIKTDKNTLALFLGQMAVCNMIQGMILISRAVYTLWPVQTLEGCFFSATMIFVTSGQYLACILLAYVGLYLSLKKMSVNKAAMTHKMAAILSLMSALLWCTTAAAGYGFKNPAWVMRSADCGYATGHHMPGYIFVTVSMLVATIILIFICHVITARLLSNATKALDPSNNQQAVDVSSSGPEAEAASKWLDQNRKVIKMMLTISVTYVFCWIIILVIMYMMNTCPTCVRKIPGWLLYTTRYLFASQYVLNGIIYIVKIKEFKDVFKRIFCSCVKNQVCPESSLVQTEKPII